jgi:hypothetical protein
MVVLGAILLAGLTTFTVAVSRAAGTVLVVPGTGNPMPDPAFIDAEWRNFVEPTNPACGSLCTQVPVDYPASFWPIILFGLDQLHSDTWNLSVQTGVDNLGTDLAQQYAADPTGHFYLVGYSQGSTVVSYFKRGYADNPLGPALPDLSQVTFIAAANPNRPNGGLFMRPGIFGPFTIPILDATVGIPAPTNTGVRTSDIVIQYDGVSDFPEYPINLLADANAIAGLFFIHPTYVFPDANHPDGHPYGYSIDEFTALVSGAQHAADASQCSDAVHCQQYGDTTYITLPTTDLPLLAPLRYLGEQTGLSAVTRPFADLVQPVLTVLIETAYDRTSYGTPTPFQFLIPLNPAKLLTLAPDLIAATFQGINDALGDIAGTRPAPAPTQDPFATAASFFTDASRSSRPVAAGPASAIDTAAATIAPSTPVDTTSTNLTTTGGTTTGDSKTVTTTTTLSSSATEPDTTATTPVTDTTTTSGGAAMSGTGTTTATLDTTKGAKFTPGTTSSGTGTPTAQDPSTGTVSGATSAASTESGATTTSDPCATSGTSAAGTSTSGSTTSGSSATTKP